MRNCLMIMSVRDEEIIKHSLSKLNIPKVWFKGFTEYELNTHIPSFIERTDYDNYFIVSDDVIISPENFSYLEEALHKYEIVTGWGSFRQNHHLATIHSQGKQWIHCQGGQLPMMEKYNKYFKTYEIDALPDEFEVSFTGWFFTGVRRHIWLEHPYHTIAANINQGVNQYLASTDAQWSHRITRQNKYKQMCIKKAHTTHVSYVTVPGEKSWWKYDFNKKEIIEELD